MSPDPDSEQYKQAELLAAQQAHPEELPSDGDDVIEGLEVDDAS